MDQRLINAYIEDRRLKTTLKHLVITALGLICVVIGFIRLYAGR